MGEHTAPQVVPFPGCFGRSAGQQVEERSLTCVNLQEFVVDQVLDPRGQFGLLRPDASGVAHVRDENAGVGMSQAGFDHVLQVREVHRGGRRKVQRAVAGYEVTHPVLDEAMTGQVDVNGVTRLDFPLQFLQRHQDTESSGLIFEERKDMFFGYASPPGALKKVAEGVRVGGGKLEWFGVRVIRHSDHDRPQPFAVDLWCVLGEEGGRRQGDDQNDDPRESVAYWLYPP